MTMRASSPTFSGSSAVPSPRVRRVSVVASFLVLALTLVRGPAVAAVFNVSPGADLQATLAAAGANGDPSNTILLAPGVYDLTSELAVGSAFAGRTLRLEGVQGAAATFLDGGNTHRILNVLPSALGGHVVIAGLTLRNGRAQGTSGGALQVLQTQVTLLGCSFVDNHADWLGGAVMISGHQDQTQRGLVLLEVEGSTFDGNLADGAGGAIYVQDTSLEVRTSSFSNNEATGIANGLLNSPRGSGGAIYVFSGGVDVDASSFTANISNWAGGAVRAAEADAVITGSTFNANSVVRNVAGDPFNKGDGGALQLQAINEVHSFTVEDNVIQNGVAGGLGGGSHIFVGTTASVIALRRNRFESNSAGNNGGIAIDGCAIPSVICPAGQLGAATVVLEGNELVTNSATELYGAGSVSGVTELYFAANEVRANTATEGFASVRFRDIACTLVARNRFLDNINPVTASATLEGALSLFSLRACPTSPRAAVVENNFFAGNRGRLAGALVISQSPRVDVVGNTFSDNTVVDAEAAAVWVLSDAMFENNFFSGSDPAIGDGFAIRVHEAGLALQVNQNGFFENELGLVLDPFQVLGPDVVYSTAPQLNGSASATLNAEIDPTFVDAGSGDLHLQSTSLAVDQGSCLLFSLPAVDIDGDSRPNGAACDLGADEFSLNLLTITKRGGTGTVTSVPTGIDCGGDCSETYPSPTAVALSVTPTGDSEFVRWEGDADCADGAVTMSLPRTCEAVFQLKPLLSVSKSGSGSGHVGSAPAGIDCGADCNERYDSGTGVDLTVTPDAGSSFAGWSGHPDCSDASVFLTEDIACTATLSLLRTLEVTKAGAGTGSVTSMPGGISCGADCTEVYPEATEVSLSVVPDIGSEFGSWSGPADCADGVVSLVTDLSCSAVFAVCSDPSEFQVPAQTVTSSATFEACNQLIVGTGGFTVEGPGGNVTLRSGNSMSFENGFSVGQNGTLQALIGPPSSLP